MSEKGSRNATPRGSKRGSKGNTPRSSKANTPKGSKSNTPLPPADLAVPAVSEENGAGRLNRGLRYVFNRESTPYTCIQKVNVHNMMKLYYRYATNKFQTANSVLFSGTLRTLSLKNKRLGKTC